MRRSKRGCGCVAMNSQSQSALQEDLVMALQHLGKSSSQHTRLGRNSEKYRVLTETTNLSNPSRYAGNVEHG